MSEQERAREAAAEVWAMFSVCGPGTLMGPNETLLAEWLRAHARSEVARALERAAEIVESQVQTPEPRMGGGPVQRENARTLVVVKRAATAIRALLQEPEETT